jgi:hypothetical protein
MSDRDDRLSPCYQGLRSAAPNMGSHQYGSRLTIAHDDASFGNSPSERSSERPFPLFLLFLQENNSGD